MTQSQIDLKNQIDLQNQLEQATADLTTRPLLNDSPVLYIDTSEPTPTNSLEQMEQDKIEHNTSKVPLPLNDTDHTHATPPPPKKKQYQNYERSCLSFLANLSSFHIFPTLTF